MGAAGTSSIGGEGPALHSARQAWGVLASGYEPALFAAKCLLGGMLAYYVALRIDLPRPAWAVTTSYIVAQPLAGAVLSKAAFRVGGTILGAAAAVVLVPNFVNEPAVLCLAFAAWLGVCLYFALLDRTPRSYVFLLAGYTASIIGLPSVEAPGEIFETAIVRVQEIGLGILCGSLVHGLILPRTVTRQLLDRVGRIVADAERWSAEALVGERLETITAERRRLALDMAELHQLATHLPFDMASRRPRIRTVRALQDQLALVLPLAGALEDRVARLREVAGDLTPAEAALLADARKWVEGAGGPAGTVPDRLKERSAGGMSDHEREAGELIARAAAMEPAIAAPFQRIAALRLSLFARLAELIAAHRDLRLLVEQIRSPTSRPVSPGVRALLAGANRRTLHRDRGTAFRAAMGAAAAMLIACTFWIGTGWADGATAVTFVGVCCALFANNDAPVLATIGFLRGTVVGVLVAGVYVFAIFPQITELPLLMIALAPALLIISALIAINPRSFATLGALLAVLNSLGLGARYSGDFAAFANSSLALSLGVLAAAVLIGLFEAAGGGEVATRLIRAGRHDLARLAAGRGTPDPLGFATRMLDRIGLLSPRLPMEGPDAGKPLLGMLTDLRVGLAAGELRQLRYDRTGEAGAIKPVLATLSTYYAARVPDQPSPDLLHAIDAGLEGIVHDRQADRRRRGALALISLRRNLFPQAPVAEALAA